MTEGPEPPGRARAVGDGPPGGGGREPEGDAGARASGGRLWEVDLHAHTSASYDCLADPAEVVERAREAGLDRIAVTDHDEIEGALDARQIDAELVIVGEEVRTEEGLDLIGLFLHRRIRPGWPLREVADAVHAQGGVTYLPHPFDGRRGASPETLDELADCVDVVEGFNARVHDASANRRARRWAEARGLPVGAGSDAHLLAEIGRGRVRLPPFRDPAGFVDALSGATIDGRPSGRWVHLGSTWAKIRKKLG